MLDVAMSNRGKAADRLRLLVAELPEMGGPGLRPLVEIELAKLLAVEVKPVVSAGLRVRRRR